MKPPSLTQVLLQRTAASKACVVRLPKFLSSEDIKRCFDLRDEHHLRLGTPRLARRGWQTTYLSAGGFFRARAPDLHARLRALRRNVDLSPFSDTASAADARALLDGLKVRCIEVHEGEPGGSLNDPRHFDNGSVVTADVLLDDGFEGGVFSTLEAGGVAADHPFEQGDALIFPSYKYHSVAPVTAGRRATLVIEFWQGDENRCNHRCNLVRKANGDTAPCPDAPADGGCPDLLTVLFTRPGSFGCGFAFRDAENPNEGDPEKIQDGRPVMAVVSKVHPSTQAEDHPRLVPGLVLTHVVGTTVEGLGFTDLDAVLAGAVVSAVRPVELRFERLAVDLTEPFIK